MRWSVPEYVVSRMDHEGYVEPPVTSSDTYPDYIAQEVQKTVEAVQAHQNANTFTFGFITDTHYAVRLKPTHQIRARRYLNAFREIAKRAHVEFLAMGGDHVNDGDKQYKSDCFRGLRAELDGIRYFPANGNHDDNSIWDDNFIPADVATQHLTREERYVLFYNHVPSQGGKINRKAPGLYYYVDNADVKVRSIFLDTGDIPYIFDNGKLRYLHQGTYAFSQEQLDWLTDTALKFDEPGWTVVLFGHVPPVLRGVNDDEDISHLNILQDILKAYKEGGSCSVEKGAGSDFHQKVEADFSGYHRAEIACMMLGHMHTDHTVVHNGIRYIETGCGIMYTGSKHNLPRKDGTASEILFDIVTIDPVKRTIHLARAGAGEDREFTY